MFVADVMKRDVKTIRPDASVREAAEIMNKQHLGSLVVVSGAGEVVGIVTERDILTDIVAPGKVSQDVKVSEIMTENVITIPPETSLEDAADIMVKNKIKRLPVVARGTVVGIITTTDLIAYEHKLVEKVAELLRISPLQSIGG